MPIDIFQIAHSKAAPFGDDCYLCADVQACERCILERSRLNACHGVVFATYYHIFWDGYCACQLGIVAFAVLFLYHLYSVLSHFVPDAVHLIAVGGDVELFPYGIRFVRIDIAGRHLHGDVGFVESVEGGAVGIDYTRVVRFERCQCRAAFEGTGGYVADIMQVQLSDGCAT